jgi:hypothetical protein
MSDHAVIIAFKYGQKSLDALRALEDQLEDAVAKADAGEFDGDEIATDLSDGSLYLYGPDADALWTAIAPAVKAARFMRGAQVRLRYGPPEDGTRETTLVVE